MVTVHHLLNSLLRHVLLLHPLLLTSSHTTSTPLMLEPPLSSPTHPCQNPISSPPASSPSQDHNNAENWSFHLEFFWPTNLAQSLLTECRYFINSFRRHIYITHSGFTQFLRCQVLILANHAVRNNCHQTFLLTSLILRASLTFWLKRLNFPMSVEFLQGEEKFTFIEDVANAKSVTILIKGKI